MGNLYKIIEEIQKDLYCPVCGRSFDVGEIRLRGLFDHTLIIQTICANNHMTLFMTTYQRKNEQSLVSSDDLIDFHKNLETFNGDFENLW